MYTHGVASNIHRGIKINLQSKHLHISPVWFSSSCLRVNCRIIAVCRQATSQASGPWCMWKVCRKGYTPVLHLFTLLLLGNNNTQSYHLCFECFYIWSFFPAQRIKQQPPFVSCWSWQKITWRTWRRHEELCSCPGSPSCLVSAPCLSSTAPPCYLRLQSQDKFLNSSKRSVGGRP